MLHEVDEFGGQQGGIVGLVSILDGSAIYGLVPGMRGVLGARGRWMLKLVEGFLYLCGHVNVTNTFVVVPNNVETPI